MAGHSHWSKIKRAKGATDAKRGKLWSKVARKIIIAAKNGGDPRDNPQMSHPTQMLGHLFNSNSNIGLQKNMNRRHFRWDIAQLIFNHIFKTIIARF